MNFNHTEKITIHPQRKLVSAHLQRVQKNLLHINHLLEIDWGEKNSKEYRFLNNAVETHFQPLNTDPNKSPD